VYDERWGEAVKVYIVLCDGEPATAQEIIDYCRTRMARYRVPKQVEFRTELPRSTSGKVLRRQLLQQQQDARAAAVRAGEATRQRAA
jgi:long-chain acyl-CoA synthetase